MRKNGTEQIVWAVTGAVIGAATTFFLLKNKGGGECVGLQLTSPKVVDIKKGDKIQVLVVTQEGKEADVIELLGRGYEQFELLGEGLIKLTTKESPQDVGPESFPMLQAGSVPYAVIDVRKV